MKNTYNSLSKYLNNNIEYASVNEGKFSDAISKLFKWNNDTKPTEEQTTKAKGLLGLFGALKASLSDEDDEITKAYKTAMKEEQDQLTNQQKDLQLKYEKLEAAKITAKSKLKQNQRKLKHDERVAAYDARLAQVNAFATRAKNIRVILTANETDSMLRTINEVGKDLQIGEDSPLKQMMNLSMQICVGPDGKVRSLDEIKELAKTDETLAKHLADYDKLAKDHGKVMISSMQDQKAFSAAFGSFQKAADEERAAEAELTEANKGFEEYEANRKVVEEVNNARTELNNAKEGVAAAEKVLNDCKGANPFVKLGDDGKPKTPEHKDVKAALEIPSDKLNEFVVDKKFSVDKYIEHLKNNGVPQEVADKIKDNLNAQTVQGTDFDGINTAIRGALNGRPKTDGSNGIDPETTITDADLDNIIKGAGAKAEKDYSELQAKVTEAQTKLNNTPDPMDPAALEDKPEDDPETLERKKKLRELREKYDAIPDEVEVSKGVVISKDKAYDSTNANGKAYASSITEKKEAAEKRRQEIDSNRAARAESRKHALESINERESLNLTPEEQEAIENKISGLQAGESFDKDGNVGYYKVDPKDPKKKEFIKRPENMTAEQEEQYIKERDTNTLLMDPKTNTASDSGMKVKKIDGKWHMYDPNEPDKEPVECSQDEAISLLANRKMAEQSEATIIKKKQDFKDVIKKSINPDGTLNSKEYAKLSDAQKTQLKAVINNPTLLDNAFKGIDLGGNDESLSEIKKHLKSLNNTDDENALEKSLEKVEDANAEIDDVDNERDDAAFNNRDKSKDGSKDDEWEDDKNAGEDEDDPYDGKMDSDEDEEVEDTDNAKNDEGAELIKGDDGKWYKKKEDGTADTESGPQENVSKKTQKTKLKNPAKIWHRKKNKNNGKMTKSYYKKNEKGEWESTSSKDFRQKVKAYQAAKAKKKKEESQHGIDDNNSVIDYTSFRNWLFENVNKTNHFNELKSFLIHQL